MDLFLYGCDPTKTDAAVRVFPLVMSRCSSTLEFDLHLLRGKSKENCARV